MKTKIKVLIMGRNYLLNILNKESSFSMSYLHKLVAPFVFFNGGNFPGFKMYNGETYNPGQIKFSGGAKDVYWQLMDEYIHEEILSFLEKIKQHLLKAKRKDFNYILSETDKHVDGIIHVIYRHMAKIAKRISTPPQIHINKADEISGCEGVIEDKKFYMKAMIGRDYEIFKAEVIQIRKYKKITQVRGFFMEFFSNVVAKYFQ